jgi:hypothetical protein
LKNGKRENMTEPISKRSLGKLREVQNRTKSNSPHLVGKLTLQRGLLIELGKAISETGASEIECQIAGWLSADHQGKYISVQLSPPYNRPPAPQTLDDFFTGPNESQRAETESGCDK